MKPPRDFNPPLPPIPELTVEELIALGETERQRRFRHQREQEWAARREDTRRMASGALVAAGDQPPGYLSDDQAVGPFARRELRALPRSGRVVQAGIDTWSPAWYAMPASALERAMEALGEGPRRSVQLLHDQVMGHRVGWFPNSGLVFAEGHPAGEGLCCPDELPAVLEALETSLQDRGIPVAPDCRAGIRRVDSTVDLQTDSAAEGLAILAGVAALSVARGKVVAYRWGRTIETVLMKTITGKTVGRVYDKGIESGAAPKGRLIRPEDQRRYVKATRRDVAELTSEYVRGQYQRRFMPLYESARGVKVGGPVVLATRLREAVEAGMIEPSRARSLGGYLLTEAVDMPQGSRSTRYALEKECRQLGLVLGDGALDEVEVDLGSILEECLESEAWARRG